ncbi:MAG: RNB domain-containing ribonuclease [Methanomicrobiales archaeon]|nr:RNB domain-containing ribonuclease [Methanomicrobiales archaeon]
MGNHESIDLNALAVAEMKQQGFEPAFPPPVMKEIGNLPETILDQKGLTDLRALLWSSIDNVDSQDLDQLEYCEQLSNGHILVRVAISDVDLLVPQNSATDRHAAHNGTSVYTGVETFPMLPDRLAKGLTSLLPEKDHRVVVIEYTILDDGVIKHGGIYPALARNHAKLVYEDVGSWLEGLSPLPEMVNNVPLLEEQLHLQYEAALRLRTYRMDRGALDLETSEPQVIMEAGEIRDIIEQKENAARRLIEEFMIAANVTIAKYLDSAGRPMIERVVRVPKYWDAIVETAASFGEKLPIQPDPKALSEFLTRRKEADPGHFQDLSLTIVKLLGAAEYLPLYPEEVPFGHFGLAIPDYTHGTAPNRRYVDIIIQRLIKATIREEKNPYTREELVERSKWLTDRDKAAKKVERFMRKAAAAVLLGDRTGETFEGFVTGVTRHGTFARIIDPPAEGKVVQGEKGLRVGNKVVLRLLKTDPYQGYIDLACIKKRA